MTQTMNRSMPGTTSGQHSFAQVPSADIPRSQFNRPSGLKTTFDAGWLIPCYIDEVLPGDTHAVKMQAFARLATPLKPLMDNIYLDVHFWFVPMRLVWNNWERFQGEQTNPGDSTAYTIPIITAFGPTVGSVFDYFGIPPTVVNAFNALPLRAYNLIYNEHYRDENLQNSVTVPLTDGPDANGTFTLLRRGKRHDYFTSALTAPQKGTAVTIPLLGSAPVFANAPHSVPTLWNTTTGTAAGTMARALGGAGTAINITGAGAGGETLGWDDPKLTANLASATGATINSLRQAFQIQKAFERDARGGTRYTEALWARWRVRSDDGRLQRPEFLGGGTAPIVISPIAQTSVTAATPQGNLAAVGTMSLGGIGFARSFTEHGYIIGIMSARSDMNYAQGIDRMWTRSTRFDFAEPVFTHIGEQTILNKEIYTDASANDNLVFGYQERHAEYRYKPSVATALMRPQVAGTLGTIWTLVNNFTALPTLASTFIQENPDIDRVIAVPAEPHFIMDGYFDTKCARALPMFGVPGLIDHF